MPPKMLKEQLISPRSSVAGASVSMAETKMTNMKYEMKMEAGLMSVEEEMALDAERQKRHRRMQWIFNGMAASSMGVSLAAIYSAAYSITCFAFSIPVLVAPYAAVQRKKINKSETLCDITNKIRMEVNILMKENMKIKQENDQLEESVTKLHDAEESLKEILDSQGEDLNSFQNLLQENRGIQKQIKECLKAKVIQNFITAMLRSDYDENFEMSDNEIEYLLMHLKHLSGVEIEDDRFRETLRNSRSRSVKTIMAVSQELLQETSPEAGSIFNLNTQDLTVEQVFSFDE